MNWLAWLGQWPAAWFGAQGDTPPPEPPVEPPVTTPPPPAFTGGVGGFVRRELSDRERKELLRRVRKSLGLDKKLEPPQPVIEVPSTVGPVSSAVMVVRRAAEALEADDEEVVLLAAAGW